MIRLISALLCLLLTGFTGSLAAQESEKADSNKTEKKKEDKKDLSSLEPGKLADLVILDKNHLENIRNTNTVRFVMKNGRLYEGESLDEVYSRKRKAPDFNWRGSAPGGLPGLSSGQ